MLLNNICNDVTQTSVTNMLQQQHVPVAPATTTLLQRPVTCTLSIHRVVQSGAPAMPAWFKDACWSRGELASEDDGSLNTAALAELYCAGRHHWSGGVVPGSTARSFADAACGAVERAHADHTGSTAGFLAMPNAVQVVKLLEYLSSCVWPSLLNQWRAGDHNLLADAHDLFAYNECRGIGAVAERALLGNPTRARAVLRQLHPLHGVLDGCSDTTVVVSALRALCSSTRPSGEITWVTLNDVLAVNQALAAARPLCSGATFGALSFAERVSRAKELCESNRSCHQFNSYSGAGHFGGDSSGSVGGSAKVAGKYDRVLLEKAKNGEWYNVTKGQLQAAYAAGETDRAILICLRGADAPTLAAPGARPKRLPPHKVLTDLLLGNPVGNKDGHLETWSVDKDLDAVMSALRRAMPAFWGNRVFKHLQLDMNKAVPLKELAQIMANTSNWADCVPDFYREGLLKARVADGDLGVEVHHSYNHAPDADPWANAQLVASLSTLVAGLLSDIGVRPDATVFDFTRAKPDDISSPLDVFGFMAHVHSRLGALPTTASKLSSFIRGLLGDLGANRHGARASSDPKRALGTRFVELSSVRLKDFIRYRDDQLRGREIQAQLRAAGLVTDHGGAAGGSVSAAAEIAASNKRAAADFDAEVLKEVKKRLKSAAATTQGGARGSGGATTPASDDGPPSVAVLLDDGKRVHITGGRRGPDGCTYLVAGPAGVAHALTSLHSDVGPVRWICARTKLDDDCTRTLCAKSKWPGDGNVLDEEPAGLTDLKLASFRINEDGSQYASRFGRGAGAGAGAGAGGRGRGAGGGRGRGGGRGGAIVLAANLASGSSFVMSGAPRTDVVMANAPLLPAASPFAPSVLASSAAAPKSDAVSGKIREVADELHALEEAAARCDARRAARLPLLPEDEVPASKEKSLGPGLRKQLIALSGGLSGGPGRAAQPAGSIPVGFDNALSGRRARAPVTFAPGTPPTGAGVAFGARGVWSSHVGARPARGGLEAPRIFRFDDDDVPSCATLLVPVRMDVASGLVLKPIGNALFGQAYADEPSRDAAVSASRPMVAALLGADADFSVYLAGEWVDGDYRWRVVLCVVGGTFGADMATALRDGSSSCRTCRCAYWLRSSELAGSRAGEIALAALARARAAVRPASRLDSRLQIGRGTRRWADTSQDAAVASRPLLGETLPPAGTVVVSNQRGGADVAHEGYTEVRVDRSTPLGNPFKVSAESLRDPACEAYVEYISDPVLADVNEIALRHGLVVDSRFATGPAVGAAAARAMDQLEARLRAGEKLNLRCWCAPLRCHGNAIADALSQRLEVGAPPRASGPDASHARARIVEHMGQAHAEVRQLLHDEAAAHRQRGCQDLAAFLEGCASRVEPPPLHEVPADLQALALTDSDIRELSTRPFARNTVVTTTAAPVYKTRPDAFPAHLPEPTCHASFLQAEVVSSCLDWYADADAWHRQRMAGADATRPKGLAYGFDALRPEWRPFFEAGGVVLFDERTGQPKCLTTSNYPLRASLNGDFATREFADYPDQEMVAAMRDGVCIKAQGLPVLQLGCNLEALYDANGVAGVRSVATELDKFASYDDTGWLMRAPKADRRRGVLPTATLPSCTSPIGAVPKKDGGTRIITDMTFPYGRLSLREVSAAPLPPEHRWDGVSPYRPTDSRPYESSTTLGGGGSVALPPNVASGPSKPPTNERYTPNGPHPWPREGKCTVAEQAHNDVILSVPCQLAGLPQYNLAWDFWKCFHQKHYRPYEVIATAAHVPHLDGHGEVSDHLRGITNGRMAMGGLFASGLCQRDGNAIYFKTMQRFDARQRARRLIEPESPAVAGWLAAREGLPHDDYGSQARLAAGGFYSDDPKITVVGPPSRVLDLALSFYEVVGPDGLGFKLADHTKWQVACWASWQGVRMSGMLGVLWLPPDKALRANEELQEYGAGRMVGAAFVKMMGYLNYLAEVLVVHANLNRLLWQSYDSLKLRCPPSDLGVTVVRPGSAQRRAVDTWRRIIMRTPGTTLLRIVRRAPPPQDNATVWAIASDACMDFITVDGVKVAGCLHGGVDRKGQPMHDPPGMGGVLYGRLWQYAFSAAEIEVVTIPVAEFMAAVVGLMVYDSVGALEYAERICLEVDAEATPRTALQGKAHRPGLLIAHDEFTRLKVYGKYKSRLMGQHVFGAGNEGADKASRSRNAEAERLVRFLGLEPRWLPLPAEAHSYKDAVVKRLRDIQRPKTTPGTCDPAEPGGDAPRFGGSPSPPIAWRPPAPYSPPVSPPPARSVTRASPVLLVAGRQRGSPYAVPDDAESPRAPAASPRSSPPVMRVLAFLPSPPAVPRQQSGKGPAPPVVFAPSVAAARPPNACPAVAGATASDDEPVSFLVAQRLDILMAVNQNNTRPHAFRGDPEHLRALLGSSLRAQARAANENSVAAEEAHKRLYWIPYCKLQNTAPLRPDVQSLTYDEAQLESAWWAGLIPFVQKRMPSQQGVVGAALPHSILKVAQNIRRAHVRLGIHTVPLASCVRATEGLLKDFILEHGPLALIPKRKEPLTNEEIASIFCFSGPIGSARSRRHLDWLSPEYSSLLAMFHTLAQTGMRKGEVSLPKNARFDKSRLSMRNVRWSIGGVVYDELTPELYARLCAEGGYALLRPPPSKADPFSLHWGPCTIYLRFSATEAINAARELAREEIRRRVPLPERESAPLFVKADGSAWRHAELAQTFNDIVVAVRGPARAAQVSMHSWRVYLACALLSKGASFATIQTMLRWRSEDALRIYARINNFAYADWLTSAQGASVSSVRTTTGIVGQLAAAPEPGTVAGALREAVAMQAAVQTAGAPEAGFQHEWRRRAAEAVDVAVRAAHAEETQPEYDAYHRVATLSNSMGSLILAAQRADEEEGL